MKKIIIVFICLFTLWTKALSINIISSNDHLSISFPDYSPIYLHSDNDVSGYLSYQNISPIFLNREQNTSTDKIELIFAVPNSQKVFLSDIKFEDISFPISSNAVLLPSKQDLHIEKLGNVRNVDLVKVVIKPLNYNLITNEAVYRKYKSFNLNFGTTLTHSDVKLSNAENSFYSYILNKEQIPSIYNLSKSKKIFSNILSVPFSFNSNLEYLKLETEFDGIAMVSASDIISKVPSFKNKPLVHFHLLNDEVNVPIYFEDINNNGSLDENDVLYFVGERVKGDTTYYNNYTKYNAFFLYYDETELGIFYKFNENTNISNANTINSVKYDIHLEKEKNYFWNENYDSKPIKTQLWFWDIIRPKELPPGNFKFETSNFIPNLSSVDDKMSIKLKYISLRDTLINTYPTFEYHYNLKYSVNGDTLQDIVFTRIKEDYMTANFVNAELASGINLIELLSFEVLKELKKEDKRNNLVAIDYIKVFGEALPEAYKGRTEFKINTNELSKITIPGFSSNKIIAIDKQNNEIYIPNSKRGHLLRASAKAGEKPYVSLMLGDDSYYSTEPGLHIAYLSNNTFTTKYYKVDYIPAQTLIEQLPKDTPIAIAFNGIENFSFLKNTLSSLNSKEVEFITTGDALTLTTLARSEGKLKESRNSVAFANVINFIETGAGNNFYIDLFVDADKEFDFVINDNNFIEVANLSTISKNNLVDTEISADIIIIANPLFKQSAELLQQHYNEYYKDMSTIIAYTDDIYNQFNWGKKSPYAIKNFLVYANESWNEPAPLYLVLLGDASEDPRGLLSNTTTIDYLPTYGYPSSDFWYSLLNPDNGTELPFINIGRIPINNNEEFLDYFNKLKVAYTYARNPRPWMKRFLYVSGGINDNERRWFYDYKYDAFNLHLAPPPFGADTVSIKKGDNIAGSESEGTLIRNQVNRGLTWLNFLGHASAEIFDLSGWQPNSFSNKNRYGVLSTLSCNTGAFALNNLQRSLNERYLFEPEKAFVIALGGTITGFVAPQVRIYTKMMSAIADTTLRIRRLSDLLNYSKLFILNPDDVSQVSSRYNYSLLGDPLYSLPIDNFIDLYIDRNDIVARNELGKNIHTEDNFYIDFTIPFHNAGYCIDEPFEVVITKTYTDLFGNVSDEILKFDFSSICLTDSINFRLDIEQLAGDYQLLIEIDPANVIDESRKDNNVVVYNFKVHRKQVSIVEPQNYMGVDSKLPLFRVVNPIEDEEGYEYLFEIFSVFGADYNLLKTSNSSEIYEYETHIDWKPAEGLSQNTYYLLRAYSKPKSESNFGPPLELFFHTFNQENDYMKSWLMSQVAHLNNIQKEKFKIDNENNSLQLETKVADFQIISQYGTYNISPEIKSWVNIEVGGNVFVDTEYNIGFNIVTIPIDANKSTARYRRFDTWGSNLDIKLDSASYRLVRFLSDSVSSDEYVFIATCRPSFRLLSLWENAFGPDTIGSITSLRNILKEFGSKEADNIIGPIGKSHEPEKWEYTYVMIGRKGANDIIESLNNTRDSIIITGNLKRYNSSGSMKINGIGKAHNFSNVEFDFHNPALADYKIDVYGYDYSGQRKFIKEVQNESYFDFTEYNEELAYLDLEINVQQSEFIFNNLFDADVFGLNSIRSIFQPAAEFAVVQSECFIDGEEFLRGEFANLNLGFRNLSTHTLINNLPINVRIQNLNGFIDLPDMIENFRPDEKISLIYKLETEYYDNQNSIISFVNPNFAVSELYDFNNTYQSELIVHEDTIKPEIKVKVDGKYVKDGDYISLQPFIEIELYDNTPLQITDTSKISARINGYYHPGEKTINAEFIPINDGTNLKAIFKFIPDTLQFTDVLLLAYGADNNNNRDTLRLNLRTYLTNNERFFSDIKVLPNPFENSTVFRILYNAPENSGLLKLEIFDISGSLIQTLSQDAIIGVNEIYWDGLNSNNRLISPGVYFYRVSLFNSFYTKPQTGKIIKVY